MSSIKIVLKSRLKNAQRVAVLGIGSLLRADDAAGVIIAKELKVQIKDNNKKNRLKFFLGETAPENLTGQIKKFKPTHLIIIDAVDFHLKPGSLRIVNISTEAGASFSTHRVPVGVLRDYLYKSLSCETILIGMQPGSMEFCGCLSPGVEEAIQAAGNEIGEVLKDFVLSPRV
ncbi:MAG: hydrogenase 3 maturation endopeptidase HyCI [Candidatus Omnitrophica bacterium]|jgi:hydrogenase 3 maturation protease|nr:hydrogenase 3 maturation endopeptidase HyCI [Candidatus Omnitrophota bacterium]